MKMKCNNNHLLIFRKSKELDNTNENRYVTWCMVQIIGHNIESNNMANTNYCSNGNRYCAPLRCHRIINTWPIMTNEVSKLLWFNFILYFFPHLNNDLYVLILKANQNVLRHFFWGLYMGRFSHSYHFCDSYHLQNKYFSGLSSFSDILSCLPIKTFNK